MEEPVLCVAWFVGMALLWTQCVRHGRDVREESPVEESSLAHHATVRQAASNHPRGVLVVGIAGGSGSGKTTLAKAIYDSLGYAKCAYITHDSYYKDAGSLSQEERGQLNFDDPKQLDTALLVEHVRELRAHRAVALPTYDFATHRRTKEVVFQSPRPVVIVEGILIFADPALCSLLDLKVFVDTDSDVRLVRRIARDIKERGRTFESVVDQYMSTVRPMFHKYVGPSKANADMVVPADCGSQHNINVHALDCIVARLRSFLDQNEEEGSK